MTINLREAFKQADRPTKLLIRAELETLLKKQYVQIYRYINGSTEPKHTQYLIIINTFRKYGII
jgi:predicted alternative tryptophan synthase beta-subunit